MCNKDLCRSPLSADMSTDSRPTCRPSTDRYVGRYIGRYSVDKSTDCRSTDRSVCRSSLGRYVAIDCRWCIGRLSVVSEYCSRLSSWNSSRILAHRGCGTRLYRLFSCVDRARCSPNCCQFENISIRSSTQRISRLFAWNCGLYWTGDCLHASAKCDLAKSRLITVLTEANIFKKKSSRPIPVNHAMHNPGFLPLILKNIGRLSKFQPSYTFWPSRTPHYELRRLQHCLKSTR